MDASAVVMMNQIMGSITQGICCGTADSLINDVFWESEEAVLRISDLDVDVRGIGNIKKIYEKYQYADGFFGAFHMLHSNSYQTKEEQGVAQWNTHSMWLTHDEENKISGMRFGYFRFVGKFSCRGTIWKLQELSVHALIIFPEWKNSICESQLYLPKLKRCEPVDADDYIQIRNTIGRYVQEGPGNMLRLFSEREFETYYLERITKEPVTEYEELLAFLERLSQEEIRNQLYKFHMIAASFVIQMEPDQNHASIQCLSQMMYFEPDKENKNKVQLCVGWMQARLVKEQKEWKFCSVDIRPVAWMEKKQMEIIPGRRMLMQESENWPLAPENQHCTAGYASDLFEAESILPHWTERLKRGDNADFVSEFMDNALEEISMGMSSGRVYGYDNVCKSAGVSTKPFENDMAKRFPQFHTGCSPVMEINDKRDHIQISWTDYGWGNVGYNVIYEETEKNRMYRPMIGQYYHKFVKDKETWKMYSFGWTPTINSFPEWTYHTDEVKGWASKPLKTQWPLPLEDYKK